MDMKKYSIPEAIIFLKQEYGGDKMPTSEETLRRAIRTKMLVAQEEGDPGRKGYTIAEQELRDYAKKRLDRARSRAGRPKRMGDAAPSVSGEKESPPEPFTALYGRYITGEIKPELYYQMLYLEKGKWETCMHEKQLQLAQLNTRIVALESEIQTCRSAIDAYEREISKQ